MSDVTLGIKVKDGALCIDISALVETLDDATKAEVAKHVVADEWLWKAVLEAVADESNFFFTKEDGHGAWWLSRESMLEIRAKLIPLMPDVAKHAVAEALRQRDAAKAESACHSKWAWAMWHAWPEEYRRNRPDVPGLFSTEAKAGGRNE